MKLALLLLFLSFVLPLCAQREATLQQQKMCAEQASKVREEYRDFGSVEVRNHYSVRDNICFVMVHCLGTRDSKLVSELSQIVDGFERTQYGSCLFNYDPYRRLGCSAKDPDDRQPELSMTAPPGAPLWKQLTSRVNLARPCFFTFPD